MPASATQGGHNNEHFSRICTIYMCDVANAVWVLVQHMWEFYTACRVVTPINTFTTQAVLIFAIASAAA